MPSGVATSVATVATLIESRIAVHSVGVMSTTSKFMLASGGRLDQVVEAVFLQHRLRSLGVEIVEIFLGLGLGGRCRRYRIDDRRMRVGREGANDLHAGPDR